MGRICLYDEHVEDTEQRHGQETALYVFANVRSLSSDKSFVPVQLGQGIAA